MNKLRMMGMMVAASVAMTLQAFSAEGWLTDYKKAVAQAKAEKKQVLIDFTGSDWCGWCMKLDREVFSQDEFKAYAKEHLVLLELDFPKKKEISAELKAQNEGLARQFKVEGFPTIVVLNSDGKPAGVTGYVPGGPSAFIAELKKVAPKK